MSPAWEKSLLWHNIWLEYGRPRDGLIADIMRRTRAVYNDNNNKNELDWRSE